MRIAIVSEYILDRSFGGTEVYVDELLQYLLKEKHEIILIGVGDSYQQYPSKGYETFIIPRNKHNVTENLYFFEDIITAFTPDVVHFHTLTPSIDISHIKFCKQNKLKTFFTAHVPSFTCLRGSLLYMGKQVCDGLMIEDRCNRCYYDLRISQKGLKFLKEPLSDIAAGIAKYNPNNPFMLKLKSLKELSENCTGIILVSEWQRQLFILNGVSENILHVCRQGGSDAFKAEKRLPDGKINIGFSGRIDPIKGLHLLVDAFLQFERKNVSLIIYGIVSESHREYYNNLRIITKDNSSIEWNLNKTKEEVSEGMKGMDVLCIPSQWYETGPFTLYEAFAMGIPVIGSDLGGVRELVEHNRTGLLFKFDSISALKESLENFVDDELLRHTLINSIKPMRNSENIGMEMSEIYQKYLS